MLCSPSPQPSVKIDSTAHSQAYPSLVWWYLHLRQPLERPIAGKSLLTVLLGKSSDEGWSERLITLATRVLDGFLLLPGSNLSSSIWSLWAFSLVQVLSHFPLSNPLLSSPLLSSRWGTQYHAHETYTFLTSMTYPFLPTFLKLPVQSSLCHRNLTFHVQFIWSSVWILSW